MKKRGIIIGVILLMASLFCDLNAQELPMWLRFRIGRSLKYPLAGYSDQMQFDPTAPLCQEEQFERDKYLARMKREEAIRKMNSQSQPLAGYREQTSSTSEIPTDWEQQFAHNKYLERKEHEEIAQHDEAPENFSASYSGQTQTDSSTPLGWELQYGHDHILNRMKLEEKARMEYLQKKKLKKRKYKTDNNNNNDDDGSINSLMHLLIVTPIEMFGGPETQFFNSGMAPNTISQPTPQATHHNRRPKPMR